MKLLQCVALASIGFLGGCSVPTEDSAPKPVAEPTTTYSDGQNIGDGSIRSYVSLDASGVPTEVGIELTMTALNGLPEKRNNYSRCFDTDGDGVLVPGAECDGDLEVRSPIPVNAASADLPYQWIGVNFNPEGHVPPNWGVPHFDFHFHMVSEERVDSIRTGPCGMHMNCEDQDRGVLPVPEKYVPAGFISIGAVVPAMGNHLIDSASPQMGPPFDPASNVVIYGAFDGHIIFIEPMITSEFLLGKPNSCFPVPQPAAVEQRGYYPQSYCINYDEGTDSLRVSLQQLILREAS